MRPAMEVVDNVWIIKHSGFTDCCSVSKPARASQAAGGIAEIKHHFLAQIMNKGSPVGAWRAYANPVEADFHPILGGVGAGGGGL